MAVNSLGESAEQFMVKLPKPVAEALRAIAAEEYETPAAWARRAIIEKLRANGKLPRSQIGEEIA